MKRIIIALAALAFSMALVACSGGDSDSDTQDKEQRALRNSYIACSEVCYFTQGGALEDVSALLDAASTGDADKADTASSSLAAGIKALQGVKVPDDLVDQHAKLLGAASQLGEAGISYLNATTIYDSAMVDMNPTDLVEYNQCITEAGEKGEEASDILIEVKEALY